MVEEPDPQRIERQSRSVDHLQELYSVVVAIALSLAIDRLIPASGASVRPHRVALFGALLVTVIPFYHGALRHLDEQYAHNTSRAVMKGSVLIDFWLLILQSGALVVLAVSIGRPRVFASTLLGLLALDSLWAWLSTRFLVKGSNFSAQRSWMAINLVAVAVLGVVLELVRLHHIRLGALWWIVPFVALIRTALDYLTTWPFYAAVDEP